MMSTAAQARTTPLTAGQAATTGALTTRRRRPRRPHLGQVGIHILLIGMTALVLAPFVWMLLGSFKSYDDLINRPSLPPSPFTVANYKEIFQQAYFGSAFINSTMVAVSRV